MEQPLRTHTFVFNDNDTSGEHVSLTTKFFLSDNPSGVFTNQELTLQSYRNSATILLFGAAMTPNVLRELADQLEKCMAETREIAKKGRNNAKI